MFSTLAKLAAAPAALLRTPENTYEPPADNGFFGPGSVTWKVWSYPSSILVGFQRAVTIEQLDPHLNAAVEHAGGVRYRPRTRYERTVRYFAIAAFADTATATKAADVLVKVHSKAIGTDPVSGRRYDANDPDSQLWIHVTAWHSILYCYEVFGPGRLSAEEEGRYWEECARAAQLQTIDPADVPRSREEVRAYFEQWRPRLAASELAQSMTDFILHTEIAFPEDLPRWATPVKVPLARVLGKATISTYPKYMRKLFGIRQSGVEDVVVRQVVRLAFLGLHRVTPLYWRAGEIVIPTTMPIVAHVILGTPAKSDVTMTPREAQKLYGYDAPAQAHKALRAKQERRVFGEGAAPSDEGLVESETYIGSMSGVAR